MRTRIDKPAVPQMQLEIDAIRSAGRPDQAEVLQKQLDEERARILGPKPVKELVIGLDGIVTTKEEFNEITTEGQDPLNPGRK